MGGDNKSFLDLFHPHSNEAYYLMGLISIASFSIVAWFPLVNPALADYYKIDQWAYQHLRIFYTLCQGFEEFWPGPLKIPLTNAHRLLLGLMHGLTGWLFGWLIFKMFSWWPVRILYLGAAWGLWMGSLIFLAKLLAL